MDEQNNLRIPGFKYKPTPNAEIYKEVTEAVRENNNYCCCETEKTDDTKCMCKNFRLQDESGFCHCGRFYKVREFDTITILCTPEDHDHALNMAYTLTKMGFIVTLPMYFGMFGYSKDPDLFNELQKAKIHQASTVIVCNSCQAAVDFLADGILWAEELQKKIIYEHMEEVKENEV